MSTLKAQRIYLFSLLDQCADDETPADFSVSGGLTKPGQVYDFLLQFSLTLSIQIFLCLPLLLFSSMCPFKTAIDSLSPSIRSLCPNHLSLLFFIFATAVSWVQGLLMYFHFWLFLFYSCLCIFSSSSSPSPTVFSRPLFSDSDIPSRTATWALPGRATRARYQGAIEFHLGSNGDALFSPHFSESPECCTCQAYSPLDILLTSSTLRYKPSQIENLWMKTKCKLWIQLELHVVVFLMCGASAAKSFAA